MPALELAAMGGCRVCGGPLQAEDSPLPWHGPALVRAVRRRTI